MMGFGCDSFSGQKEPQKVLIVDCRVVFERIMEETVSRRLVFTVGELFDMRCYGSYRFDVVVRVENSDDSDGVAVRNGCVPKLTAVEAVFVLREPTSTITNLV